MTTANESINKRKRKEYTKKIDKNRKVKKKWMNKIDD
jgi:hypothetical protein